MAAAAAAADGALLDAAARWRGSRPRSRAPRESGRTAGPRWPPAWPGTATPPPRIWSRPPAAADPAPRGLAVLIAGAGAVVDALQGGFETATRRLAGLAAATVPADPMASDRWDELAVTVVAAGGDDRAAQLILGGQAGSAPAAATSCWAPGCSCARAT